MQTTNNIYHSNYKHVRERHFLFSQRQRLNSAENRTGFASHQRLEFPELLPSYKAFNFRVSANSPRMRVPAFYIVFFCISALGFFRLSRIRALYKDAYAGKTFRVTSAINEHALEILCFKNEKEFEQRRRESSTMQKIRC